MIRTTPLSTLLQGVLAGAVAVWVMDRFDWFVYENENPAARKRTDRIRPGGMDPAHVMADKLAHAMGKTLDKSEPHRHPAGLAIHYAVPMALSALYAVLKEKFPRLRTGSGCLYGLGIFVVLDYAVNPVLGLAANPVRYPWQRHVRESLTHMIYGFVTNAATDILGRLHFSPVKVTLHSDTR